LKLQDLLEYELLFSVGIKSISQFPENKTDLLIIPKFLGSVSKEMSKIQKKFARFSIAFAGFLWIIIHFRPKVLLLRHLATTIAPFQDVEVSGLNHVTLKLNNKKAASKSGFFIHGQSFIRYPCGLLRLGLLSWVSVFVNLF